MRSCQIQHKFRCSDDLCKLGKDMQVLQFFSGQNSETFDILHILLPLTVAKLSTLKIIPVYFGLPPPHTHLQTMS